MNIRLRRSLLYTPGSNARALAKCRTVPADAGKSVLRIEGKMVERLHLKDAERLLALGQVAALRGL